MLEEEELCASEYNQQVVGSISVDNTLEVVMISMMLLIMLLLITYIVFQIKTKNIWGDLKGREKRMLQALMFFCLAACHLYLVVGSVQIYLYRLILDKDIDGQTFSTFFKIYFVATMSVGICMNNILFIVSYIWQYIISNYFGARQKNLLLAVFLVLIVASTGIIILGFTLKQISPNGSPLLWASSIIFSFISPVIATIVCLRFLNKIKMLQLGGQTADSLRVQVRYLMFASIVRALYAIYATLVSNYEQINYFRVDRNCHRIYIWGVFVNVFVNLTRFFVPIFIVTRLFGKTQDKTQQPSLYESIHQRSRADSQTRSQIQ